MDVGRNKTEIKRGKNEEKGEEKNRLRNKRQELREGTGDYKNKEGEEKGNKG